MIVETPSKLKSSISIFLNYFYGFQLDLNFVLFHGYFMTE